MRIVATSRLCLTACLVGFGALAGLGALGVASLPDAPGVTYRNFTRVEIGMTQAEAEAIFGGLPSWTAPNGRNWIGLLML
jgi:hypothetical protein